MPSQESILYHRPPQVWGTQGAPQSQARRRATKFSVDEKSLDMVLSEAAALDENKALKLRVQELEQEIDMMKIEGVSASGTFVCCTGTSLRLTDTQGVDELSRDMTLFIQTEQSIRSQLQQLRAAGTVRKDDLRRLRLPYEEQQKFGEDIQRKMIARVAALKAEISAMAKTIK